MLFKIGIYDNIDISIDILPYRIESSNIVSLGMRIDIESNRDKPSDLHPYWFVSM